MRWKKQSRKIIDKGDGLFQSPYLFATRLYAIAIATVFPVALTFRDVSKGLRDGFWPSQKVSFLVVQTNPKFPSGQIFRPTEFRQNKQFRPTDFPGELNILGEIEVSGQKQNIFKMEQAFSCQK